MKDDRLYLVHILECIDRINSYVGEKGESALMNSTLIQDTVLRNLQIMAESAQHLSDTIKASHSDMPWHQISGFRNILVHDYFDVKLDLVWNTIERDLPVLKCAVSEILEEFEK